MNYVINLTNVVVAAMLGGELPSCYSWVILTRLKHDASHNDFSVICHVSEILDDASLSCYYLPRC
jgi:hypothetical protein